MDRQTTNFMHSKMSSLSASIIILSAIIVAEAHISIRDAQNETAIRIKDIGEVAVITEHFYVHIKINVSQILETASIMQDIVNEMKPEDCENFQHCKAILEVIESQQQRSYKELEEILQTHRVKPKRGRRSIWDGFGTIIKLVGGSMDSEDRKEIQDKIDHLTEESGNVSEVVKQVKQVNVDALSKVQSILDEMHGLNKGVRNDTDSLERFVFLQVKSILLNREIEGVKNIIQLKKLSTQIVSVELMRKILESKRDALKKNEKLAYETVLEWIANQDTTVRRNGQYMDVSLELPILSTDQFSLYEINPIPVVWKSKIAIIHTATKLMAVSDHTHIQIEDKTRCRRFKNKNICDISAIAIVNNNIHHTCVETAVIKRAINMGDCTERITTAEIKAMSVITVDLDEAMLINNGSLIKIVERCNNINATKWYNTSLVMDISEGCEIWINEGIRLTSAASTEIHERSKIEHPTTQAEEFMLSQKSSPDFIGNKLMSLDSLVKQMDNIKVEATDGVDAFFFVFSTHLISLF